MSEPQAELAQTRAEQIDAAWDSAQTPVDGGEPEITPEALDEKPAERFSTAPSIREFIQSQRGEAPGPTSELEKEISELRAALDSIRAGGQQEKAPSNDELVLAKLEALEAREAEKSEADATARAEEAFNQRVSALRAGAIENINARKEDFPGLVALEQQETVVNALFQRLEEGQETSEDEVSSEVETGLREVYEKLHAVYGSTQSKAQQPASERQQTLNQNLVGEDSQPDLSTMTRQEKIDYLWGKSQKQL